MAKRAICVGINKFAKYPQFALNGCVNDAKDMVALCKQVLGFKASEVTLLTDAQATKAAILAALKAAVKQAVAGKISYLLFAWSSHGTQMADASGDEPDGMDEAFVPYDIAEKAGDWDPAHIITDDEFHDLFQQLPDNVLLEVYLDPCHSGSGLRGAEFGLHAPRPRMWHRRPGKARAGRLQCAALRWDRKKRRARRRPSLASTTFCGADARPTRPAPTPTSTAATTAPSPTTT
jgi:metacaspase-1